MKTLNDYMNDPSVVSEPMPLREVHAIRLMIYDETKDMTPTERTAYYNDGLKEIKGKYNLNVVSSARRI
ncbi:MAG: hypothetical protein FWH57_11530 [Oscillospiraceae bacterium]|nr:hypothetical protein [Oscillospiraceae bacterium]